ncbi:rRNA maturation RNase YbeY [Patescibacteria group bacterium]|nr:rRNA maturation RNase YbeY [Patescibacteria group bacterium]
MPRLFLVAENRVPAILGDEKTRRVLRTSLAMAGFADAARITVVWVGDAEMRRVNRQTRGKDKTTDVLSFPLTTPGKWPGKVKELGDILLSVPELRREAKRRDCTLAEEALLLLVHGTLHLLGYDHMRPTERKRMFRLQNTIVSSLGADRVRLPLNGE